MANDPNAPSFEPMYDSSSSDAHQSVNPITPNGVTPVLDALAEQKALGAPLLILALMMNEPILVAGKSSALAPFTNNRAPKRLCDPCKVQAAA